MACRYYYKGHEFRNEMELDDFLIERRQYESILGDIVFSDAPNSLLSIETQLLTIQKDAKDIYDSYMEARRRGELEYGENGEVTYVKPPFIGVNKFLSGLKNEKGELLFPEFRLKEYWNRRFDDWKNGKFTDAEIEEFELDKNNLVPIPEQTITKPDGSKTTNHELMSKLMMNKWKVLGETGTAIHNVLLIYFSKQDGTYNFTLSDVDLKETIMRGLEPKNKKYLTDEIIDLVISYAKNLRKNLEEKYGEGLSYYPEFMIMLDTNRIEDGKPKKLFGLIDLLIVDKQGCTQILDYKTSIHRYSQFSTAKKSAYSYQMAVYRRMLEKYGISSYGGKLMVAPIQIVNFRKSGDTYIYDGIAAPENFITINTTLNSDKMWDNIDEFMPHSFELTITGNNIGETIATWMAKNFPAYSSTRTINEEYTVLFLKSIKKLDPDENGVYMFRKEGNKPPITATTEAEFVKKVTEYLKGLPGKRLKLTGDVKFFIKEAMKVGIDNADFPKPSDAKLDRNGDKNWLQSTLAKYCDGNWEVVDNSVLESYGIIMLKTKNGISNVPEQVDFVRVSTNDLFVNYRKYLNKGNALKNRRGLTGTHESDVSAQSKSNSLMAEAVNGNVELMETLAIINLTSGLEGCVVGNILVVNPIYANGVQMSNEQLLYCFNQLNKFVPIPNNKIASGEIKFARKYELVILELIRIVNAGERKEWKDEYKDLKIFKSAIPSYDTVVNSKAEDQIKELLKLLREIESHNRLFDQISGTFSKQSDLMKIPVSLHNDISIAIAQLKGVNFRQQLKDHNKFLESTMIHQQGVSGSYTDNPGNLNSDTLNLVTKLVTEAYLNTRDDILKKKIEVLKFVKEIKREAGFSRLSESTIGNLTDLYKDMYEITADGNFLFKNPNRLLGAKRAFLEYALNEINQKRFPQKSKLELELMKANNDIAYYEVPLAIGGSDSVVSTQGLLSLFRAKLSYFNPVTAFERAKEKVLGVYNTLYEAEEETEIKSQVLYRMANLFDMGLGSDRVDKIKQKGILNFEHNLETLLMKHMFAYSVQENMDAVFPMIRAAMIHITTLGAMRNTSFENDILYLEDYILNKIHNKSIVDPKYTKWAAAATMLKLAASKMTLAFAPVQMFYQPLQGFWLDISLMIRKPDGKNSFTFENFRRATKLVYGDLVHFSDTPTLCLLVNEQYGINDMDMNVYIDRISSAKKGIWNFENLMFKFASRPDFYNRMIIFTSLMMGDGCLDAHSVNSEGKLVYDWKKDKRYAAFANNNKSNLEEYNKARSLYYAAALLFVNEHAKNADGSSFELNMSNPMPLPRAYTSKEAESMKSLADDIYGYYSHEKKSLIMSTAIGSLWLLFKTYWSGKKNQYLAKGGVKLRGDWKHYTENGLKYYYQVDADGNILYDKPPTTTETIAPVYQWSGLWQEGIIITLSDLVKDMYDKGIITGFKEKWNIEDENLRNAYRSNVKLFGYDLIMFALVGSIIGALLGDWLDELKKDNKKNKDFTTGLGIAAANVAVMSVKNSFLDLNFIESIGSPIGQWTPFAFDWGYRTFRNWWKVAMGEEDFWDGVVKTSSGLKQIKPALDAIKPDIFRTEQEGGTFNKKKK